MRSGRRLLSIMALVAAIVPAYAQQQSSGDPAASQGVQRVLDEIGTAIGEYWTPKLNDYKNRIDRTLSSGDLATLDRLRVRWSMILEEQRLAAKGTEIQGGGTRIDTETQRRTNEVMEIFTTVKEIATRYRGELDQVGTAVTDDYAGYLTLLSEQGDRFMALNRAEVAANPNAKKFVTGKTKLQEMAATIRTEKSRKEIAMVYAFAFEPIVMLYNGAGLNRLLSGMPGSSEISGITLPEMSALRQNFPNPASNSTTIVYTLGQASSSTVIRLFDARGDLVESFDQGARAAGEHEIEIDVSKLASGSYLYHLTVQTEKGPRVYSRAMQVVR